MRIRLGGSLLLVVVTALSGRADQRFDTKTASFAITYHDETSAYRDSSVVLMPGATVVFNAIGGPPGDYAASTKDGTLVQRAARRWVWTAPQRPGTYLIAIEGPGKMSAFRTPFYNRAIGDVEFSAHQWGSAADVYVDPENTNRMADLNGDGRIDVQDSRRLYDELERMLAAKELTPYQGGMGFYPGTAAHPPFVHVDVRGTRARWQG